MGIGVVHVAVVAWFVGESGVERYACDERSARSGSMGSRGIGAGRRGGKMRANA